ncbi:MAG TPA: LptF/LptG family permease, partial [Candidatus Saccharimonadales bacterium]|nr:LptF/LptG family permease [Candidatus Saccharimonadales bacterium]
MTRIQRYVFRELLGPTFVGLLAYGLILLMNLSMHAAEMMIRRDLPVTLVLEFIALALPRILVLTLPIAVLVGILVGVGRLVADNELGALRSLGYNERSLIVPALALGLLTTALTWFLFDSAVPAANYAQHQLQARIFISSDLNREIQPRTFFEKIPDLLIYANDANPADGTLQQVLIHQKTPEGRDEISTAGRARIEYRAEDGVLNFRLENVVSHSWDRSDPQTYQVAHRDEETLVRPPDIFTTEMLRTLEKPPPPNLREQDVFQLMETIRSFDTMQPGAIRKRFRNEAWVELHKKFALPATCLVFAFLALPLGLTQRRGGKAWGFFISFLVVVVQYFLLTTGEQTADRGRISAWLAMWMGNLFFLGVGAILLLIGGRMSWDPGAMLHRLLFWRRASRAPEPADPGDLAAEGSQVSAAAGRGRQHAPRFTPPELPFWRRRMLPAIDLYLLRTFLFVGVLVGLSLTVLFALYSSLDLIDEMSRADRPIGLLAEYLANVLPQFVTSYVLPMALCASTLITFALLARSHELTALRSAGVGPLRVSWAFIATAAVAAVVSLGALDSVLPATN